MPLDSASLWLSSLRGSIRLVQDPVSCSVTRGLIGHHCETLINHLCTPGISSDVEGLLFKSTLSRTLVYKVYRQPGALIIVLGPLRDAVEKGRDRPPESAPPRRPVEGKRLFSQSKWQDIYLLKRNSTLKEYQ